MFWSVCFLRVEESFQKQIQALLWWYLDPSGLGSCAWFPHGAARERAISARGKHGLGDSARYWCAFAAWRVGETEGHAQTDGEKQLRGKTAENVEATELRKTKRA